jgi:hypothetical protein
MFIDGLERTAGAGLERGAIVGGEKDRGAGAAAGGMALGPGLKDGAAGRATSTGDGATGRGEKLGAARCAKEGVRLKAPGWTGGAIGRAGNC